MCRHCKNQFGDKFANLTKVSFKSYGAVGGRSVVGGCTKGERESVPEISLPIINVTRERRAACKKWDRLLCYNDAM